MNVDLRSDNSMTVALTSLREIRFKLLTSLESQTAIGEFLACVADKFGLSSVALYFVNHDRQLLEAPNRPELTRVRRNQPRILDLQTSLAGRAVLSGTTVYETFADNGFLSGWQRVGRPTVEVAIPIRVDARVVAVLDVSWSSDAKIPVQSQHLLEIVADDLAIALSNLKVVSRLRERLTSDELTGVLSDHNFLEGLRIEIKRSIRNGAPLGVLLLELDNLAELNSRYGHAGRDSAMKQVAELLKRNSRTTDLLGRLGEAEFAIALGGADIDKSLLVAEKFRSLIANHSFEEVDRVTVSIGVAVYPVHALGSEELVLMSRQSACLAKYSGGDQVSIVGSDSMRELTMKAFSVIVNGQSFRTGPQFADEVASHLQEVASDPIFSSVVQQIVESLAAAIDAKDHYTKNHSEEATVYAEALGGACKLEEKRMELVRMAAKLHDIGKIGVPESILRKNGPLDPAEWVVMKEHPTIGAMILRPIQSLADLVPIVQCHHERWNGSGYPAGLKGSEIPLEARIIAVIDSYHAIISERPYKPAMPVSYALDQLRSQAGTNFDPDLIEKFCSLIDHEGGIRGSPQSPSEQTLPPSFSSNEEGLLDSQGTVAWIEAQEIQTPAKH